MVKNIILLFFTSIAYLSGQDTTLLLPEYIPNYFYVEVESEDSTEYELTFGVFQPNEENLIKKQDPLEMNASSFIEELQLQLEELPDHKKNILIYIHGMWGHRMFFHQQVLDSYQKDVVGDPNSPIGIVISIIWHSGMNYWTNSDHAYRVGKFYNPIVEEILALPFNEKNIICHSMGNRVFQGIFSEFENIESIQSPIDRIFFVAADLEENIFAVGQPLESIGEYCNFPVVFVHNNDRSLGMSKALNENKRLGLNGDESTCDDNNAITIVDVSVIKDNEGFAPSMSNHRYFYTSPTVRHDIKMVLEETSNPNRSLISERRWKLTEADENKKDGGK